MILAIIAPSQNVYSETFIQAHKNNLNGTVHYIYGSAIHFKSEYTSQKLLPKSFWDKVIFHMEYGLKNKGLTKVQYALKKYLLKHKVQCILAEYGTTGAEIYPVCKNLDIPLIVHFHGYDASAHTILEENKGAYKEMFETATYIIGVSTVMIDKLKQLGANENKLIYNTYGPNDSFFEIKKNKSEFPLFFGLGRFVDKKAPYYTLMAFSKVVKKYPNAQLVLGGDGPLLESSMNLSKYLGIENNVTFPGVLNQEEIQKYLSQALAFVQHSITALDGDMEGTPVGILEASAAAVPVISTFHAGIPDVIIHKQTGLLCEEHDYNKMAEHLVYVIKHPEEAEKMGFEGRKNIKQYFSMKRHIDTLNQLIQKAINE